MNSVCFETGWSHKYAYELYMNDIYDIIYRDLEYFPSGPADLKADREAKIKALRGKR